MAINMSLLFLALIYLANGWVYKYPPEDSVCPVDNCEYCHPWRGCFWCEEGYYRSRGSCESCKDRDINCIDCWGRRCKTCAGGYYYSRKERLCVPCPESCVSCDWHGYCLECENEQEPNKDGTCPPVPCPKIFCEFRVDNCEECNGCYVCKTCKKGFHLDKYGDCVCSSDSCEPCKEGFFNDNGECRSCRDFDPSCVTCSEEGFCDVCAGGYYNDNGACIPCSESCVECIDNTQCTRCESGIVQEDGSCPPVLCIAVICPDRVDNCEICRGCNVCDECQPGFFLDEEGICVEQTH